MDYRPPPFSRSGFERRFFELAREAGLPVPSMAFNEEGYELDVYWQPERFAGEKAPGASLGDAGLNLDQAAGERAAD